MYKKLAGMTGTAQTEATEFAEIYNLDVVSIPTTKTVKRIDKNSRPIFIKVREKFEAVCNRIKTTMMKRTTVYLELLLLRNQVHKIFSW